MNGPVRTLLALVVGLALGAALRASGQASLIGVAGGLAPVGAAWLAALQMTLVPLVFTMVVSGVGSWANAGQSGQVVAKTLGVFLLMLLLAAAGGVSLMNALLRLWPTSPGALAFLHAAAPPAPPALPSIAEQFVALIPTNPIGAAAQGMMTPLVLFAVVFALALAKAPEPQRQALNQIFQTVSETMMVIVQWVLKLAPAGIFVLGLGVALNTGLAAVGALAQLVVMTCAVLSVGIAACYLVARIAGGVPFGRFARAAINPQAVAAGTTSSMATLPAMIEAAERGLGCPPALAGAVLPLAVSTFRFGNVLLVGATAVFAAHVAGIHPTVAQTAVAALVVILTNIGIAGLPAAVVLYAAVAPAFQAIGAPLTLLPLVIAVSALPDIFDTVCNVTADLAATSVVQRLVPTPAVVADAAPSQAQAAETVPALSTRRRGP